MGTVIALICIISLFFKHDLVLTVLKAFNRNTCKEVAQKIYLNFPKKIFAIIKTYAKFKLENEDELLSNLPEQYLVICNHQSLVDTIAFIRYLKTKRTRFISKSALKKNIPLVSNLLKINGHCIINRKAGPTEMMATLDSFANNAKENNWIPILFPEGTRSRTGQLNTLHSAGFRRLLIKAPMPVLVCALDGGWKISGIRGVMNNLKNATFRIKALKIYPTPTTKAEQLQILEESKNLIKNQLEEWRK
ncbi:MAG: 1-acyl-sn-glycerol-3-phosphate acyltransferase [Treponema sp.]|nr:MAG: 1-acyl-sn-glycerol-3-phosphate acyltransferase [Treponema sp.]